MSEKRSVVIGFEGCTAREANAFALDLRAHLRSLDDSVEASQAKSKAGTQDAGSLVSIIFDPTVVASFVALLTVFVRRNSGVKLTIKTPNGDVVADHLNSQDAPRLLQALTALKSTGKKSEEGDTLDQENDAGDGQSDDPRK